MLSKLWTHIKEVPIFQGAQNANTLHYKDLFDMRIKGGEECENLTEELKEHNNH